MGGEVMLPEVRGDYLGRANYWLEVIHENANKPYVLILDPAKRFSFIEDEKVYLVRPGEEELSTAFLGMLTSTYTYEHPVDILLCCDPEKLSTMFNYYPDEYINLLGKNKVKIFVPSEMDKKSSYLGLRRWNGVIDFYDRENVDDVLNKYVSDIA